jgi:Htaa
MTTPASAHGSDGDLVWGVLGSFVDYVRTMEGQVTLIAPATPTADGRFRFPLVSADGGAAKFGGGVRFVAHGGALTLEIDEPWITPGEGAQRQTLSVRGTRATNSEGSRLAFADIHSNNSTTLTTAATVAFDFRYGSGMSLAPIEFAATGA